jgi:hypothetical protein
MTASQHDSIFMINLNLCLERFSANATVIAALFRSVSELQARWRPSAEAWSLLEVVNHLYDEEREDFRQRLDLILHQPGAPWPPIHPGAWVTERGYNERDLQTSLDAWLQERHASLTWLRSLKNPDWGRSATAPWGGVLRAGDMLGSWLAHDHLHIRQMNELHYAYIKATAKPFDVGYAGDW